MFNFKIKMNNSVRLLICLILCNLYVMNGQDISKHTWKNRLLLVITDHPNNLDFQKQINLLKKDRKGLVERKLIVYQITSGAYREGLLYTSVWQESKVLFEHYVSKDDAFEIILIGLDGGIKLRQTELLDTETLFSTIDKMPMRRSEMKSND